MTQDELKALVGQAALKYVVPGEIVGVPDPTETRNYWAVEPGTRLVCLGAGAGAGHPYGRWIAEEAEQGG